MTQPTDTAASVSSDDSLETSATFADLGVEASIVRALDDAGIKHPFVIQEMSIPIALTGADLIGQARTGTGKTLAFGVPILQRILLEGDEDFEELEAPGKPQALIMTPTRELALQVANDIATASTHRQARVMTIYGGVSYDEQLDKLNSGVDVVVGTPGRLLDLANRRSLDLSHISILVLDEADEMLDLGFLPDVEKLLSRTPKSRQTMMFSATMPTQIVALSRAYLNQPVRVRAEGHDAQATVPDTTQFVYQAHDLDKPEILGRVLQADDTEKMMVFTRTKRAAQRLSDELEDRGFSVTSIHGDLSQAAREKALKRFRKGEIRVLVATDVAARGIDVSGVSHVVNYECPDDAKTYVHRIGRTGRAGAKGVAITLVDWADSTRWRVINRMLELPFHEPPETYSTSAHLYTDLSIPEGTKGRLPGAEPKVREPRPERGRGRGRDSRPDSGRGDSSRSEGGRRRGRRDDSTAAPEAEKSERAEKKPRTRSRQRRRLRNGKPVEGATD